MSSVALNLKPFQAQGLWLAVMTDEFDIPNVMPLLFEKTTVPVVLAVCVTKTPALELSVRILVPAPGAFVEVS